MRPNEHSIPAEQGDKVGRSHDVNADGATTARERVSMAFVFFWLNCP